MTSSLQPVLPGSIQTGDLLVIFREQIKQQNTQIQKIKKNIHLIEEQAVSALRKAVREFNIRSSKTLEGYYQVAYLQSNYYYNFPRYKICYAYKVRGLTLKTAKKYRLGYIHYGKYTVKDYDNDLVFWKSSAKKYAKILAGPVPKKPVQNFNQDLKKLLKKYGKTCT